VKTSGTIVCAAVFPSGKVVMGSDGLISTEDHRVCYMSKVYRTDSVLIGAAGTSTVFHILKKFIAGHKTTAAPKTADKAYTFTRPIFQEYAETLKNLLTHTKAEESGCSLLLATKNHIFLCDEFSCESVKSYGAIGSGDTIALGSLYSTFPNDNCIDMAVRAAVHYDKNCGFEGNDPSIEIL
jgi:ATP-dependent protease HslVU (ClpYQ) peptidase subunit